MQRKKLTGLRPQFYEHPFDKRALNALEGTPGLETLVRKCNEYGIERLLRVRYTGSNLRVNEDNFPMIHGQVLLACEILDLPKLPDIYILGDGSINAFTAGVEKPILVLNSGCIDLLTDEELFFVIAHELGHIKSGHVLYYQIAEFLPVFGEILDAATLGIGGLFSMGLHVALLNWQRMSEFTADRAGLLACQDADVAIRAMMKIAGLPVKYYDSINTEDFIAQAREFSGFDINTLDRVAKAISIMGETHPWTVMRANEFLKWIDSGDYDRTVSNPEAPPAQSRRAFCSGCGQALAVSVAFCPNCGTSVPPPLPMIQM
jgi:hypothetical protein